MDSEIAVALIGLGGVVVVAIINIITTLISNRKQSEKTAAEFDKRISLCEQAVNAKIDMQQAVVEVKIDTLTAEVREHNNFAKRMPVVEEQIKAANHRIDDLERRVGA